jgi:hypothetical protein
MDFPNVDAALNNFSEKDLRRSSAQVEGKTLKDGLYQWVVQGAKLQIADRGSLTGCYQINLRVQAVNADGPVAGTTKFGSITLPLNNPNVEGHTAPDWAKGMATVLVSALHPDETKVPRKNPETGVYELNGRIFSKEEVTQAYDSQRAAVTETIRGLVQEGAAGGGQIDSLKNETFFAPLETKDGYQNLSLFGMRAEPTGDVIRDI